MQGIIITIEKEELEDIVSKAVETALEKSGFFKSCNSACFYPAGSKNEGA